MFSKNTDKKQVPASKTENHKLKDYGNEPFFVEKAEAAKKVLEKYELPKQFHTTKK